MSEAVIVALIGLIGIVLGASVAWYIAVKRLPKELQNLDTEGMEHLSQALTQSTQALINRGIAAEAERRDMLDRINQLEAHRDIRSREIYTLQQNMESMSRDYVKEIQTLRDQVHTLQTQVDDGEKRYTTLKRQTLKLYQALKAANVPLEVDPDLLDTLERMKAVR